MNKTLTIILSFLYFSNLFAQTESELYKIGITNFKSEKYIESIENFSELLKIVKGKDKQKICYINRGLSYNKVKKYNLAILDFSEAIKLNENDYVSYLDRGLSKMYLENYEEALKDLHLVTEKCEIKEKVESSLYWIIRINYQQQNYALAVANCEKYININETDSEIYFLLGNANDKLKEFEKAENNFTKAINLNPNYYEAIANRGTAKINILTKNKNLFPTKRQLESACEDFKRAISLGDINEKTILNCKNFCEK
ncbi:tetratricopeptide repeat protein [Flavobacterium sp.]|uniref:tetratricopeptide repeat protein n=1 Tax=Flavobacterium sp. TaxID=239 RepID=UPI0037504A00